MPGTASRGARHDRRPKGDGSGKDGESVAGVEPVRGKEVPYFIRNHSRAAYQRHRSRQDGRGRYVLRRSGRCSVTVIRDVIERWEAKRGELARYHAQVDGEALVTEMLADMESLAAGEAPVPLSVAAAETGYTTDHLSRLIKEGKLANHGRKHAPRVKLSDCPRKRSTAGGRLAERDGLAYHPRTDARSLVGARR